MKTQATSSRQLLASWLYVALIAVGLYVIIPQLKAFHTSWHLLANSNWRWVIGAVGLSLVSYIAAGYKYVLLALHRLRLWPTVLVQIASLLANRLLPAGIGGIGVNYAYLYKAGHNKLEAGVVVSMNNLMGFVGHMSLVALLLLLFPHQAHIDLHWRNTLTVPVLVASAVILIVAGVFRSRLKQPWRVVLKSLRHYSKNTGKVGASILTSMVIASLYAACLWACLQALGVNLGFLPALLVLTLGVTASTVTPTPGGLVGVEAALVAGLVAYHLSAADALAVALLYRLITYWLALGIGAIALLYARATREL